MPILSVPQKTQFKKANLQDMRLLFTYLEFCLEQVMHETETETATFPPWRAAMHSAVQQLHVPWILSLALF